MNITQILFITITFAIAKGMVLSNLGDTNLVFPSYENPDLEFATIPSNCSGLFDCTEYVGKVLINIVLSVVYVALVIFNLVKFVGEFIVLIATYAFAGIDDAPSWVNLLLQLPLLTGTAVILYRLIRSGDSTD